MLKLPALFVGFIQALLGALLLQGGFFVGGMLVLALGIFLFKFDFGSGGNVETIQTTGFLIPGILALRSHSAGMLLAAMAFVALGLLAHAFGAKYERPSRKQSIIQFLVLLACMVLATFRHKPRLMVSGIVLLCLASLVQLFIVAPPLPSPPKDGASPSRA